MKWGRFFENLGRRNSRENTCRTRKSVPWPKWTQQWELNYVRRSSCVTSIVSIYTGGETVQGGPAHWFASKFDRLSQRKVQGQKLPILCRNYPLSLSQVILCRFVCQFHSWGGLLEFWYEWSCVLRSITCRDKIVKTVLKIDLSYKSPTRKRSLLLKRTLSFFLYKKGLSLLIKDTGKSLHSLRVLVF